MTGDPRTDVAIVGLGGAGAVAAHVLTAAGLDVVAIEAGAQVGPRAMSFDEVRNDLRAWLAEPKAKHEAPTYLPRGRAHSVPAPFPTVMMNAVGGSTVHYPALSIRFQPWHFRARSETVERYGEAAIPAGSTMADWPLSYDELEPFYGVVEGAIGVAGAAGANPFEGPRTTSYPLPPLRRSGWNDLAANGARTLGWHPFPAPAALNSEPFAGRPACTYCGFCSMNGCYLEAKGSADVALVPRAEATGRLRVVTGARVTRIETDDGGRAAAVRYVRDGVAQLQAARVVLLGAFVYENTRLLLRSAGPDWPNGLSNGAGQVGRHFTAHAAPIAWGVFPGRKLNAFNGSWAQATCVDDWNGDNFDHTGLGFVGGGMLTAPQELKPIMVASAPLPPAVPRWGSAWKRWLADHAGSLAYAVGQFDSLTYAENLLELDPTVDDPLGEPVVRISFELGENERRGHDFLLDRSREWLEAAGASETWHAPERLIEARHCYGGTRMGDDPATSVVDRYGFSHEVPNLGIIGASTFPTAGGANPTLTLQALAWRTAAHLIEDWGRRAHT
ncbi:MAG: GMC family oxidoreductase [Gaiellales bacterium]